MKPAAFVPPLAALAVAAIWLGSQRRSLSALEEESTLLREHIEAARHAGENGGDASLAANLHRKKEGADKKIDWKDLAQKQMSGRNGNDIPNMRAMIELQKRMLEMSPEELSAALDEIAALDMPAEAKRQLEGMMFSFIAQQDAEHAQLALEKFSGRLGEDSHSWQFASALSTWAKKDVAAASRWMDQQIAAGTFDSKSLDGKSGARLRLEGALVSRLIESDPAAASARVAALPEDQRADIFQQGAFFNLKPGSEKTVAEMIRAQVPADQRVSTIANMTSAMVHQGGYEKVGSFMAEIDATAEEREAIVSSSMMNKVNSDRSQPAEQAVEEFETARAWALKEAPDSADRITGDSLGQMAMRKDYGQAAALAVKYGEQSGNDQVMITFLESSASRVNPDAALGLVDKIADETKREELRKQIEGYQEGRRQPATPTPTR